MGTLKNKNIFSWKRPKDDTDCLTEVPEGWAGMRWSYTLVQTSDVKTSETGRQKSALYFNGFSHDIIWMSYCQVCSWPARYIKPVQSNLPAVLTMGVF